MDIAQIVVKLVLQLAVILAAAKIGGELFERWLKQPAVLGELVAGMIIGPYAAGAFASLPGLGSIFPRVSGESGIPISAELYAIAQIASVILLFSAGVETDVGQFIRYGPGAFVVAMGGVILPFFFGVFTTFAFGFASSYLDPVALFMGAIMTATSVGITARVLTDIDKLNTPEGLTILGGAVIDDVLGILVLAIVVSVAKSSTVSLINIGLIGAKAMGFWLALTAAGILLSNRITRLFRLFKAEGSLVALAMVLAFFGSALAEMFGLAMIIGAYSMGLAISKSDLAHEIKKHLAPVYHVFVPVFFVVMGMLVDFGAMGRALSFGIAITLLAILGKVFGCGLPALGAGFNNVGSLRIGIGMMPRGEVALIIAGIGLTSGVIKADIFGVSIMMTLVTTMLAPVALVPAFGRGGSGKRVKVREVAYQGVGVKQADPKED